MTDITSTGDYKHSSKELIGAHQGSLKCPHCGGYIYTIKVDLDAFVRAYPFNRFVGRDRNGYAAKPDNHLAFDCEDGCGKPLVLRIDGDRIYVIPARSRADRKYLGVED
jgi:hypothetical protein